MGSGLAVLGVIEVLEETVDIDFGHGVLAQGQGALLNHEIESAF